MKGPGGGHAEGDWISTGDEGWDRLLGGGVRLGSLVEISGERYVFFVIVSLTITLKGGDGSLWGSTYPMQLTKSCEREARGGQVSAGQERAHCERSARAVCLTLVMAS